MKRKVTINLEDDLHQQLKLHALFSNISLGHTIEKAIHAFLEANPLAELPTRPIVYSPSKNPISVGNQKKPKKLKKTELDELMEKVVTMHGKIIPQDLTVESESMEPQIMELNLVNGGSGYFLPSEDDMFAIVISYIRLEQEAKKLFTAPMVAELKSLLEGKPAIVYLERESGRYLPSCELSRQFCRWLGVEALSELCVYGLAQAGFIIKKP